VLAQPRQLRRRDSVEAHEAQDWCHKGDVHNSDNISAIRTLRTGLRLSVRRREGAERRGSQFTDDRLKHVRTHDALRRRALGPRPGFGDLVDEIRGYRRHLADILGDDD
jgi:hypothetical protein